jgi:hypothetical protein
VNDPKSGKGIPVVVNISGKSSLDRSRSSFLVSFDEYFSFLESFVV